ncbi:MAG: 2-phosphosulfolactate phosphatase [Bacillota bacterium]
MRETPGGKHNPGASREGERRRLQLKVAVWATAEEAADRAGDPTLPSQCAVVIDVLRATSTVVAALAAGAAGVIPVLTPEEARALARTMPGGHVILGGERKAVRIPGFDLGNSPREYRAEEVGGKTIILTTTNGTRAVHAASAAARVLMGAIMNGTAVARTVIREGRDLVIVCAGTRGSFSLEDALAAGVILEALPRAAAAEGYDLEADYDDLSLAALAIAGHYRGRLDEALRWTHHGMDLEALGFAADLDYCARLDAVPVVPVWSDGVIRLRMGEGAD